MNSILTEERKIWIKENNKKIVMAAVFLLAVLIFICMYIYRPTFSATYKITGEDQGRLIEIEVTATKGSTVTMYKDKTFLLESISQADSRVTIDKTEEQTVNDSQKAIFKIFPNELKSGANTIHFKVTSPIGLSKNYFYTLEKSRTPPTVKVQAADSVINSENVKTFSIITDPLNKIIIDGLIDTFYTKTGNEALNITSYKILQLAEKTGAGLPDILQVPVNITVTNVDGQETSETINVAIPTATGLIVGKTEDTESGTAIITGQAPPGAIIRAADSRGMADDTGNFQISVSLPKFGPNTFKVSAGRPGEKESVQNVSVNRLMPALDLTVDEVSGDRELMIKGSVTEGASVSVNGTPAVIEKDKYSWSFLYPAGISKKYTFTVKAEKEGHRTSEITITSDQNPVFRQ